MPTYKIASDEAANRYGHEIGESVELEISKDEELAVVAAGWLEPVTKTSKEEKT